MDTRLKKIADQHVADATILAAAGLKRLGIASWSGLEFRPIGFERMVPAVGQGAIAVQCRSADAGRYAGTFDEGTALGSMTSTESQPGTQGAISAGSVM